MKKNIAVALLVSAAAISFSSLALCFLDYITLEQLNAATQSTAVIVRSATPLLGRSDKKNKEDSN